MGDVPLPADVDLKSCELTRKDKGFTGLGKEMFEIDENIRCSRKRGFLISCFGEWHKALDGIISVCRLFECMNSSQSHNNDSTPSYLSGIYSIFLY